MIEQWVTQIQHLSTAQAGLLYALSIALMVLAVLYQKQQGGE